MTDKPDRFLASFEGVDYSVKSIHQVAQKAERETVLAMLRNALSEMRDASPADGSEADRAWDTCITLLEQAEEMFRTVVCKR
jgi:hypothetical protein